MAVAQRQMIRALEKRMQEHEAKDQERHAEMQAAMTTMAKSVTGFTDTLNTLVADRVAREASEKTARRIFYAAIAIAGVVVPLIVVLIEHLWK